MLNLKGYDDVKVSDSFEALPPGGYVCRITQVAVANVNERRQMQIGVDIDEGEHKGIFNRRFNPDRGWDFNAIFKRYVFDDNGNTTSQVKGLLEAVKASNPDFDFNPAKFDENTLINQLVGFTFRAKEVRGRDGKPNWFTTKIAFPMSVKKVRDGDFKVPDPEMLSPDNTFSPMDDIPDSDIPF